MFIIGTQKEIKKWQKIFQKILEKWFSLGFSISESFRILFTISLVSIVTHQQYHVAQASKDFQLAQSQIYHQTRANFPK